ncbi:MAG TPA: hypothetical protein VFG83_02485, partial [Kofleriaceae bacterium]|nr:hypothetical protein [Kofleriaceae bacterium]
MSPGYWVFGWPVSHSLSPAIHNAAFRATGLDARMTTWAVEPAGFADAVGEAVAAGGRGASVTVPHKAAALALAHRVLAPAADIGAVNCLAFADDGTITGANTDAAGFVDALAEAGFSASGKRAVILGAGGAARAVVFGLVAAGASSVAVIARSPERAAWAPGSVAPWTAASFDRLLPACDLLVDATTLGLAAGGEARAPAPIPVDALPASATVASLIYHRTPELLARARDRGLATVGGAG